MIRFKACPKCRGDVEFVRDPRGHYLHCLQCGWLLERLPAEDVRVQQVKPVA